MSKNLKQNILNKIKKDALSMRPRYLFVLATVLSIIGLIVFATIILFVFHITAFLLTHPGPGAERKVIYLLSALPWYVPVLAITSAIGSTYLFKRFDFSYRANRWLILGIIVAGLLIGNAVLNQLGLDDFLRTRGFFRHYSSPTQSEFKPQFMPGNKGKPQRLYFNK